MNLEKKKCSACSAKTPILTKIQVEELLQSLNKWHIEGGKLTLKIKVKNFKEALDLANKIGAIAETENHHPLLLVAWGELGIKIWTHVVNGLTENDFILASKIDQII
jgi:4a-hydroxytetrahydrobiopterin dehydratase